MAAERVQVSVRLPVEMAEQLRREAEGTRRSIQSIVERAVELWFLIREEPRP